MNNNARDFLKALPRTSLAVGNAKAEPKYQNKSLKVP